jgi:hypothetical protein
MSKFFEWLQSNRKHIGYTIGVLNLVAAFNYYLMGLTGMAVLWTVIGTFLIWDASEVRQDKND